MSDSVTSTSSEPAAAAPISSPPTSTATMAPAPAVQTPSDWTTGMADDLRGYVQNKGFKDSVAVVEAYRNLEKLRGVPEDRLLKLPEKEDDAQGWETVYQKLGKPAKPEDYKFQMQDQEFGKWAQSTFHELGLTTKQAEKLVTKWNGFQENAVKGQQETYHQKLNQEETALKSEWGAAYDQNINVAKQAAMGLGVDPSTVDALEKTMGFAATIKFMHSLGTKLGEGAYVSGGKQTGFGGAMTPEAAINRIQQLRGDKTFVTKYLEGDVSAKEEMARLHSFAHPGT
jgi:hypothetical protein